MHTPDSKILTKAQRHRLLRKMRQDSIRVLGEPTPLDEILPLVDKIMEIVDAEIKGLHSRNPRVRDRAERHVMEIAGFGMSMMERLYPTYLRTLWQIEHMVSAK